jgi:hypothetical protein
MFFNYWNLVFCFLFFLVFLLFLVFFDFIFEKKTLW